MKNHVNRVHDVATGQQIGAEVLGARPKMLRAGKLQPLTVEQREAIIDGLRSGQSLASILRDHPDMPGANSVLREKRDDAAWGKEYDQAHTDGVAANIEEALDYAYSVRGNKNLINAASKYAEAVMKSAPLRAPKEYGQLLKVAGADGEKLSIALVAYSAATAAPLAIEAKAETVALPSTDDDD